MIVNRTNLQCYLVLIFIKLFGAQEVPNTSSNQGSSASSLQPRFSDDDAMGFPNFNSGRFGNPTSNYPANSFSPYGNQNSNMQRPQQGYNTGNFQNRPQDYPYQQDYQNFQGYPYQGDNMNPVPNYQWPQYPNQNIQNGPVQGDYPNQDAYPYQGESNTNYQRPSYSNRPDDGYIMFPDYTSRPYQKEGMTTNQGVPGQSFQYPPQGNQYISQGNFQDTGNSNDINPNFSPDGLGNLPRENIYSPNVPNRCQLNQYDPQTNYQNPNFRPVNFPNYPSNNNPDNNRQFPGNDQGNIPNDNDYDKVAILGKPVIVPPTATSPGQAVLDNSTADAATQNKCVQDCPTTSEYNPVCGTDNVTYINPGKYNCAQKCGVGVHLQRRGSCDIVPNTLVQKKKKKHEQNRRRHYP